MHAQRQFSFRKYAHKTENFVAFLSDFVFLKMKTFEWHSQQTPYKKAEKATALECRYLSSISHINTIIGVCLKVSKYEKRMENGSFLYVTFSFLAIDFEENCVFLFSCITWAFIVLWASHINDITYMYRFVNFFSFSVTSLNFISFREIFQKKNFFWSSTRIVQLSHSNAHHHRRRVPSKYNWCSHILGTRNLFSKNRTNLIESKEK